MGVLDDAIREHLELKRRHGAAEEELRRQEEEALGPARREVAPAETDEDATSAEAEALRGEQEVLPDTQPEGAAHGNGNADEAALAEPESGVEDAPLGAPADDEASALRDDATAHDDDPTAPYDETALAEDTARHDAPALDEDEALYEERAPHEGRPLDEGDALHEERAPQDPPAFDEGTALDDEPARHDRPGLGEETELLETADHDETGHPEDTARHEVASGDETALYDVEEHFEDDEDAEPARFGDETRGGDTPPQGFEALDEDELREEDDDETGDGDVLEDTPDFLQETPEHDRLWFEQKPPRDFDFD